MVKTILFCYGVVVSLITITINLELFCIAYGCEDVLGSTHAIANRIMTIACLIWGSWLVIVLYDELRKATRPRRGRHVWASYPSYGEEPPAYMA